MTTQEVQNQAAKIIEDIQALANKPLYLEMNGHIVIEEVDGAINIRISKSFTSFENNLQPTITEMTAPPVVRRTRRASTASVGRKKIINSGNVSGFTSFVLKNGFRTKRANLVMQAYGYVPEGVPGREIITWAKEHPDFAAEVQLEIKKELIKLDEFVKNFN